MRQYENMIERFKKDITHEVKSHQSTIVFEVEKKLNMALEAEEMKENKQDEMAEEIRAKIEKEFADQFEARFNQLEEQLKEKEKVASEAKVLLNELQEKQKQIDSIPAPILSQELKAAPVVKDNSDFVIAELRKS